MAELSNNPFIDHTAGHINAVSPPPGPSSPQYSVGWQQQQQQQPPSFVGTNPGFRRSTRLPVINPPQFGQQFVGQVDTLSAGYPQPHMQAQYTEYGYQQAPTNRLWLSAPTQQQQQHQQQLLSQFDPYSNPGQLSPSPTTRTSAPTASGIAGSPPPGIQHPRTFIRSHKSELEAWDPPTWRQVQSTFESLKVAWEARKRTAESHVRALGAAGAGAGAGFFGGASGAYGAYGGYQTPQSQEIDRLNALIREAETNIDTIAAAALQMSEMFSGYRQSGDLASKRRVRESCNAAVSGLPEYPPPTL
ncbi:hypothetical protein EDB89DRAFT_2111876 [Lactarius sanguifluus]|nr:hypothetical protein EDB89DRAFT_2111876 [Lactarius sanguifluus]